MFKFCDSTSREQTDWRRHLAVAEFSVNSAINDATGKTPFEVVLGYNPSLLPSALVSTAVPAVDDLVEERKIRIQEVRNALAAAKVRQATQANKERGEEPQIAVGDLVMVDSRDRRMRYKSRRGDGRAAKLFARWDGPYRVLEANVDTSTYRLELPQDDRAHPVFHASKIKPYNVNDKDDFAGREEPQPEPIDIDGEQEWKVERIVDEKGRGARQRFLVKWDGYSDNDNTWEPLKNVEDTVAYDDWIRRNDNAAA